MNTDFLKFTDKNLGLSFDDISLLPAYSEAIPSETDISVQLCEGLSLKLPILSAAMDTVTENKMARAMAQRGGFGIIHRNMSIPSQAKEVEKVKKYESGMILDPVFLSPEEPLQKAREVMTTLSISGIPICEEGKLVGIITNRDIRFETDMNRPIQQCMTGREKLITAKKNITLQEAKKILHRHRIEKLPVVDETFCLIGLITIKDIEKSTAFPSSVKDSQGRLFVGAAIGVGKDTEERAEALISAGADLICVDTAHGHSKKVIERVRWIKKQLLPNGFVMAGNVATAEGTEALISAGADIVKVGIGPGSICTTRIISGVGVPQISAIIECAKKAQKLGRGIVADGGIRYSGDIVKALALGAGSVMLGNLLAGSDESPGETILYRGRAYKSYRGMGSLGAMRKGSKDRYAQEGRMDTKLVPEGIEGRAPYRGSVWAVLEQLSGGLRAGLGYTGSKTISDLRKKAQFIRISLQSLKESHVHDVSITKEAPNYWLE